jgi:hypothetical protein
MSDGTTSDEEFVRLFSPKIFDRLEEEAFECAVHVFRSPPGGGKTTLLRAFTPAALRAFWHVRRVPERSESYQRLLARQVMHEQDGPQMLGVMLSCASGYADLPAGVTMAQEGLFRALLDCRIVLRALRSLASLLGFSSNERLDSITLEYDNIGADLKSIPTAASCSELIRWAEQRERSVYAELDSISDTAREALPADVRFEGVLWLQSVRFVLDGKVVAPKRLLMIDDVQKLRRKQRRVLIEELTEMRLAIPVWLAERSIALGEELLSQGTREGRDIRQYSLEEIWSGARGQSQFAAFAQSILDRRLEVQSVIPSVAFSQYLRNELHLDDSKTEVEKGIKLFREEAERFSANPRYSEWLERAERFIGDASLESLRELFVTRILLARDELRSQLTLELAPLPAEELEQRDSSSVQAAADIFIREELKLPYYFGFDRLCVMATSNVEELLSLAASLYEGLRAKQVLRKPELLLSPQEQERLLKDVAKRKRDFIPKNHTEGTRAQRLLDAIGAYCRERTFLPNAPYAPGVTGVRLAQSELARLVVSEKPLSEPVATLKRVLSECVAENLLAARPSGPSTSREGGTIFYLNRTLCAHFGLPLQMGGWQDIPANELIEWMERGRVPTRRKLLEAR